MRKLLPLSLLLAGCPTPPTPPAVCEADPAWIANPSMPGEVASDESFCDFYQFSWQWFLAQTAPATGSGMPVFMGNRVYQPSGGDNQCSDAPMVGHEGVQAALIPRTVKSEDFEEVQADANAFYDQNGNVLHYNAFYTPALCESTAAGFAPGTLEVKAAWMRLDSPDPSYYMISVDLNEEQAHLGLVGLHLAIWTPNHPEMIWASWEHKRNAPLCNGHSEGSDWAFASTEAAACLSANKHDGDGPPSAACSTFSFNTPEVLPPGAVPLTGAPNNVCREYNHGNESGTSVNGNDNTANLAAIDELNKALVGEGGMLDGMWSNYEMVGAIWTKGGANSGSPPVPSTQGPANPDSPQRGSLELANMALETFQQGDTSAIPNCFGCHNYDSTKPLDVSHIQSRLLPQE